MVQCDVNIGSSLIPQRTVVNVRKGKGKIMKKKIQMIFLEKTEC